MAVGFRAASFTSSNGGPNITATEPAGTVSGDVLVAAALVEGPGSGAIAVPTGWTSDKAGNSPSTDFRYAIGYVLRGGSAPSLVFTHTGTTRYREVHIVGLTGINSTPLDSAAAAVASGTTNTGNPPATTAVSSAAMAVAFLLHWAGSGGAGWTAPSGYTLRTNNTAGNDIAIATRVLSVAGSEDPAAYGAAAAADDWDAHTMTFAPSGAAAAVVRNLASLGAGV